MLSVDVKAFTIPIPNNEDERLFILNQHQIMYSGQEPAFDRIIDLVKNFIDFPIIAISFLDRDTQFLKAACGIRIPAIPRKLSFCSYTIMTSEPLVVLDTHQDERFNHHPLVIDGPKVRSYMGFPIMVADRGDQRVALGALCLLDIVPRAMLTQKQLKTLTDFSAIISDTLTLRLQQRQAEYADEVKTAFLANMSHEIRTPMNGIMGILDLMEQTQLTEQQQTYIKHIKNSNEHLLTIVNDILDLSKVESGKMQFEYIPVDLFQLCEHVVNGFLALSQESQVELVFDYPANLPRYVKADPVRVRQILYNLVNNAIKFTPRHGTVILRAMQGCADYDIELQVIDTGVGIRPESQKVIFDAYNQADKFTHRIYGGTGLGLSVCKALAEGMSGTINVESEPGKGSMFSLCLPFEIIDKAELIKWQNPQSDEPNLAKRLPAHILLAEDNELNAMVALRSLKKYGYEVTRAKDGLEAVNIFADAPNKYQIILMDHQMPIMDGVEATKILTKRFTNLPPIIAVTAHAMHGDKDIYLKVGMQDYCTKPYKPEALDSLIQHWLQESVVVN